MYISTGFVKNAFKMWFTVLLGNFIKILTNKYYQRSPCNHSKKNIFCAYYIEHKDMHLSYYFNPTV